MGLHLSFPRSNISEKGFKYQILYLSGKTSKCDQIDLDRLGSKLMKSYMENIYVQPHDVCPNDQKILIWWLVR